MPVNSSSKECKDKIGELESAVEKLSGYGYTQAVIEEQLNKLRNDLIALEDTRFSGIGTGCCSNVFAGRNGKASHGSLSVQDLLFFLVQYSRFMIKLNIKFLKYMVRACLKRIMIMHI